MNVPKLRFKEFNDGWVEDKINALVELNPKNPSLPESFIYIDLESVSNGILLQEKIINKTDAPSRAQRQVKLNDILYQTVRPYQKNNLFIDKLSNLPYIASTGYAIMREKKIYQKFIFNKLHTDIFVNEVLDNCTGTSYPAINSNDLGNIKIYYPSNVKEQEKIGNFLSLLDKKIELQTKKIEDLKLFKKGLVNSVINSYNMKKLPLKNIINEVNNKSTINNQYEILSSTSNGLFLQKEYFNKQAASDDNTGYKIIKKGQLVLSPQNLWMGNININNTYDIGIVSPSYKIFNINDDIINIEYFNYWIKSPRALYKYLISSEQGASVVRRNLNIDLFNEIIIELPTKEEQDKIGKLLNIIDAKSSLELMQLNKLKQLKKGLMQNMFV